MEWIREPMEVNMTKSVSWCPCMGAKCRGNNAAPFLAVGQRHLTAIQVLLIKQEPVKSTMN